MVKYDTILKDGIVYHEGRLKALDIGIKDGVIAALSTELPCQSTTYCLKIPELIVLPGVIDEHTHLDLSLFNARTADDFFTGSRAAALGGVTTFIDFTDPDSADTLVSAFKKRLSLAKDKSCIDFSFHSTIIRYHSELSVEMNEVSQMGINSFKIFTAYKRQGRMLNDGQIFDVLQSAANIGGRVGFHAENNDLIELFESRLINRGKIEPEFLPESRPYFAEVEAIQRVILLAREAKAAIHFFHVTCPESVEIIQSAKKNGLKVTFETCPQYLFLSEKNLKGEEGYLFTCCPPLRNDRRKVAMGKCLSNSEIDCVATDHCFFSKEDKKRGREDFRELPYGLPGIQTLFPLIWTFFYKRDKITLKQLVDLMSTNPAKTFGLFPKKGLIKLGSDADLIVIAPDDNPQPFNLYSSGITNDWSPYKGLKISGFPRHTFVRGNHLVKDCNFIGLKGSGKFIPRS